MQIKVTLLIIIYTFSISFSRPTPDLPGIELTNKEYIDYMIANIVEDSTSDTIKSSLQEKRKTIDTTWAAPTIEDQIAMDTGAIKFGMGAIFVPKMSNNASIEPDIIIKDKNGKILKSGQTGHKFNLIPGTYTIYIGNLPKLPIKKEVKVIEGKITPVFPTWCALRIEVINENGKPIRGEYDLARLNPLQAIGRGRGRDIDLAEEIKVWFLPVGTYKILGVGSSLNSISNFLTVKLDRPGEYINYTVVQNEEDHKIAGGGILTENLEGDFKKPWSHNINIGGSVDFNTTFDKINDTTKPSLGISLLLYDIFTYTKNKVEVNNFAKIDISLNSKDFDFTNLETSIDELRFNTLFTYKLLPKFGPYARAEYVSGILQKRVHAFTTEEKENYSKSNQSVEHGFIYYDDTSGVITDSTPIKIDSTSESVIISPFISPITLQTGLGGNLQVFKNRIIDMRFLFGYGLDFENRWNSWNIVDNKSLNVDVNSELYKKYYSGKTAHTSLINASHSRFDHGPEFLLNTTIYLGSIMSIDNSLRFFVPIDRWETPDFLVRNLISLYLTSNIVIDYDYNYTLTQANQETLKVNEGRHRILLRVSFSR